MEVVINDVKNIILQYGGKPYKNGFIIEDFNDYIITIKINNMEQIKMTFYCNEDAWKVSRSFKVNSKTPRKIKILLSSFGKFKYW